MSTACSRACFELRCLITAQERDAAVGRQKELLAEIDSLKDQLDASRHAWSTMRRELDEQKQQHRADVDRENLAQATEMQSRAFKDCLAKMLSDGAVVVEPYEEVIRERVQNLVMSVHEKNKVRILKSSAACRMHFSSVRRAEALSRVTLV
jgi:coenzyme F420-reducing hydrogenase beta subunit